MLESHILDGWSIPPKLLVAQSVVWWRVIKKMSLVNVYQLRTIT